MPLADTRQDVQTLYQDHRNWLHGWLRRKLGCGEQAADLVHDTFVRILVRREPAAMRAPRAYLGTIARGLLIDHWRRQEIERAWLDELAAQPQALAPSAEERQLALELLLQIDTMLAGLRPVVRAAFLLSRLDGVGYDEIVARLGVTRRSVERYLAEALYHCYCLRHAV